MATGLYAFGKASILKGELILDGGDIRAIPVTAAYTPNLATHDYLNDVGAGARAATAVALTTQVVAVVGTKATFDADDVTWPGVAAGDAIVGVVLYLHTGTEGTSTLLGYFDYFSNLPLTPDGRDVVATWPNTADKILAM
jgi:hypothetical protein